MNQYLLLLKVKKDMSWFSKTTTWSFVLSFIKEKWVTILEKFSNSIFYIFFFNLPLKTSCTICLVFYLYEKVYLGEYSYSTSICISLEVN